MEEVSRRDFLKRSALTGAVVFSAAGAKAQEYLSLSETERNKVLHKELERITSLYNVTSYKAFTGRSDDNRKAFEFCVIKNGDSSFSLRGASADQKWEYTLYADGHKTGELPDDISKSIHVHKSQDGHIGVVDFGHAVGTTCDNLVS